MLPRLALFCLALVAPLTAAAAEFAPSRPVRLIVPLTPGGTADVLARVMAQGLAPLWNQQVVVEARPGAGAHLGAELVARSPGDGHTILFGTIGIHAAYTMYRRLGYDPAKDLAPAVLIAGMPFVVVVNPALPYRSLAEFIAAARARPGGITFGSAGLGTSTHLAGELFMLATGVRLTHIPYRGSSQAMNDLFAGTIEAMFDNLPTIPPLVADGRVRALAITSAARLPVLPETPTTDEAGVPGMVATAWFTLAAPGSTPAPLLAALNADMRAVLAEGAVRQRLVALGTTPMGGTLPELNRFIAEERERWAKVIAAAGLVVE